MRSHPSMEPLASISSLLEMHQNFLKERAQRSQYYWTITGQMCFDLIGGPMHKLACHTSLLMANLTNLIKEENGTAGALRACPMHRPAMNQRKFHQVKYVRTVTSSES